MVVDFSLCDYDNCKQHNFCKRFTIRESSNPVYFRFRNICHKNNNYQWQIKVEEELIVKDVENEGDT